MPLLLIAGLFPIDRLHPSRVGKTNLPTFLTLARKARLEFADLVRQVEGNEHATIEKK